jgi:hypothetical protein
MNLHRSFAAVVVILLVGCARGPASQRPMSQGPAPSATYSRDSGADMRNGGDGGGGGGM